MARRPTALTATSPAGEPLSCLRQADDVRPVLVALDLPVPRAEPDGAIATGTDVRAADRTARLEVHGKLLSAAREDAALMLNRDPALRSPRGQALRQLLYVFARDEAIRLLGAG